MRRPYYRTLWTFLRLREHERIDGLLRRAEQLRLAGLLAIAFHDPKRLADEDHRLKTDLGMIPTTEQLESKVADVVAAVRAIAAGELKTTVLGAESQPEATDGR